MIALDKASGRKLWQTLAGKSYRNSYGNGPRSTPTVDGDRVFALSADGTLVCLETSTGNTVWSLNIVEKFGGRIPRWGVSGSPLVDGNRVIVNPGGRGASIVALDKRNGAVLWRTLSDPPGYSSPIAAQVGGTRQIIVFTGASAVGVQAETGNALWRYRRVSNRTANIATPIFRDGHVFLSSDYGIGCALLKLTQQNGFWRPAEVYFNRNMRNHHSSSVLVGDHLYGFSSSVLTAMHWKTGAVAWRDRSVGKGTVAYADGNLYLASEDGVVGLAKATPSGYREKSRFQISRSSVPMRAVPVISGGRLYVRDQRRRLDLGQQLQPLLHQTGTFQCILKCAIAIEQPGVTRVHPQRLGHFADLPAREPVCQPRQQARFIFRDSLDPCHVPSPGHTRAPGRIPSPVGQALHPECLRRPLPEPSFGQPCYSTSKAMNLNWPSRST